MKALSEQELRCVRLLMQGHRMDRVGEMLKISPRTARFHITNARTKFDAKNVTHLVALFMDKLFREGNYEGIDPAGQRPAGDVVDSRSGGVGDGDPGRGEGS